MGALLFKTNWWAQYSPFPVLPFSHIGIKLVYTTKTQITPEVPLVLPVFVQYDPPVNTQNSSVWRIISYLCAMAALFHISDIPNESNHEPLAYTSNGCTPIEVLPVPNAYTISQQATGVFSFIFNALLHDVVYA